MSLATIIYLASVSDNLKFACGLIGFLSIVLSSLVIVIILSEVDRFPKKTIPFICAGLLLSLVALFLPSKDTIYLMVGANATQQAFSTPEAAKARKVLNLGLDKIIDNLQGSK